MPTNTNAYNSRVTDEALEKRFRDTFRSQGGAELVDDLYAQGVIVPVVDFTAAATGTTLAQNLQTAWDSSTGFISINTNTITNIITTSGFWQVDLIYNGRLSTTGSSPAFANMSIFDGTTDKTIWQFNRALSGADERGGALESTFVVFLRANDNLRGYAQGTNDYLNVWYRQIATVNGDLVQPTGFTSS